MKMSWHLTITVGIGLGAASLGGCQARIIEAGLTLPSGYYLEQVPEYIPPSPDYPLGNELRSLEAAAAGQVPVAPGAPLPPPGAPAPPPPGPGAPGAPGGPLPPGAPPFGR